MNLRKNIRNFSNFFLHIWWSLGFKKIQWAFHKFLCLNLIFNSISGILHLFFLLLIKTRQRSIFHVYLYIDVFHAFLSLTYDTKTIIHIKYVLSIVEKKISFLILLTVKLSKVERLQNRSELNRIKYEFVTANRTRTFWLFLCFL